MTRITGDDEAVASDSRVRVAGQALCTTTNSRSLDPDVDGRASFAVRDWAAERIALCWNVCRSLSDDQLRLPREAARLLTLDTRKALRHPAHDNHRNRAT